MESGLIELAEKRPHSQNLLTAFEEEEEEEEEAYISYK